MARKRRWNLGIVLLPLMWSCGSGEVPPNPAPDPNDESPAAEQPGPPSDPRLLSLRFEKSLNPQLPTDVECQFNEDQVFCLLPSGDLSLIATFEDAEGIVRLSGNVATSAVSRHDFGGSPVYSIEGADGNVRDYPVEIGQPALPLLYLDTADAAPILNREDYVAGRLRIDEDAVSSGIDFESEMEIRGRGNSTWAYPKKPYKIKLAAKAGLLGMPADKEWVLLANHLDASLLRNSLAFEFSRRAGMAWTPRSRDVEVFLNGTYLGVYTLTEQIKIADDRLDLKELDPDDLSEEKISGGYLVEVDARGTEAICWDTTHGLKFCLKEPDEPMPEQLSYLMGHIQAAEDSIYAPDFADPAEGYAKYFDVESLVNWYLIEELFKNLDSNFHSSVYFFKDREKKIHIGPVWDFDRAAGNSFDAAVADPRTWLLRSAGWFERLFEDPAFAERVTERWSELRNVEIAGLDAFIEGHAEFLRPAQANNLKAWPDRTDPATDVTELRSWLAERIAWMDAMLGEH